MDFSVLCWLFVVALGAHNLEEAIWLPKWSESAGRWHRPAGAREFRFAVLIMTALAAFAALLATVQGQGSIGAYFVCGYAVAVLLNVLFPHVLATVFLGRYMPGTATAVLLNLPVTLGLLYMAFLENYVAPERFVVVAPIVVAVMLAAIPLLLMLGRRIPTTASAG